MVPPYGLKGLAYAQVMQSCIMMIGCWIALKRRCPGLPLIPFRWHRRVFKEMVGYGISFQIISMSQMLYDPVTKALLTKFGGLPVTGFYEMASRLIMQLRALMVNANQVLVPAIADIQEKNPESIGNLYKRNYGLILYIAVPFYAAIISLAPIISDIWIGYHENIFVFSLVLLSIGWFINTLTAPSYFTYLGTGKLFWNMASHILIALLNMGVGLILGSLYGAKGVIIAWMVSLTAGSFLIILSYHAREDIHLSFLLPKEYISVVCSCIVGIVLSRFLYYEIANKLHFAVTAVIMICSFALAVIFPIWLHPMRIYLMGWARRELTNKSA
jgi:O-antigen/teichoic acid export membrane protein